MEDRRFAPEVQEKVNHDTTPNMPQVLAYGLTLVTHNTEDFKWIQGLTLLDPVEQTA